MQYTDVSEQESNLNQMESQDLEAEVEQELWSEQQDHKLSKNLSTIG